MSKLKDKRLSVGMKSVALADAVGVSKPFMWQLENDMRTARLDTWKRIAQVLGCELDEIMGPERLERIRTGDDTDESAAGD